MAGRRLFFRFAGNANPVFSGAVGFRSDQIFLAHMALLDVAADRFYHQSRMNRDGFQAAAATDLLHVFNGNWSLRMIDPEREWMRFQGRFDEHGIALDLTLRPLKSRVVFGEDGVSRKGADPDATSFYISFTRLATEGTLRLADGSSLEITGLSWMDHEIASRQLSEDLQGWDWTAITLKDGTEIKAYILRRADGTADSFSRWITIDRAGVAREFGPDRFTWTTLRSWISPHTGGTYPIELLLEGPALDPESGETVLLHLIPLRDDQQVVDKLGNTDYWEGAMQVRDGRTGEVVGSAYLELVGYSGEVSGGLR
ncbi:MAG: carotenoid 1,2-hydratase [Verrucomicrobia bacterium]|nr:carotenoid 1,2-hydratase [Verrucomicrobiota bacterium]